MALNEKAVRNLLGRVKYPGYSRDIVSFGIVKGVEVDGDSCAVKLGLTTANPGVGDQIRRECEELLRGEGGFGEVSVELEVQAHSAAPAGPQPVPGIRHTIAVASGKGGVGKSTVAVNLALALARLEARVGLLDCDVYGPSVPIMMGVRTAPEMTGERLNPAVQHGVKVMSMGLLVDPGRPVIWRGPMVGRVIQQLISDVNWGELDFLVVDLPPGTGDAQLTLCQTLPLSGAVIVTTPQEVALADVRKAASMFQQVQVPILGVVENLSYFLCPDNGRRYNLFGEGGGRREADRLKVPLLAQIPIEMAIGKGGDEGRPLMVAEPGSPPGKAFLEIAEALRRRLAN